MTCIAWDGRTLAADKRASNCGLAVSVTKIWRHGDVLLGFSGDTSVGMEMREWFKAGADPEKFPERAREDEATLVVVNNAGQVSLYMTGPFPTVIEEDCFASGSGRDFALAAMHLGLDAARAVEVACRFDIHSGNGIDALTL